MSDKFKYFTAIRFKSSNRSYYFKTTIENIAKGDKLVVETAKGLEVGTASLESDSIENYQSVLELKPVIRVATRKDLAQFSINQVDAEMAMKVCQKEIDSLKLDMNLISAEYTLDRSKVSFVYVSDERVDFRELLKNLATVFKCRIELRQIGSRDKAKIVGGIGVCGRETCCSRFITNFDVVSINMAKNQNLALNTQKLSGQCGKLMCCLKFEDDDYKKLKVDVPKVNSLVEYSGKTYKLMSVNLLKGIGRIDNKEESLFVEIKALKFKGNNNNEKTKKPKK